ncbi:MAG: hypothetical protein DHS20C09_20990 [marine bacterium B5-7]|nr:MAG: hypothetical protein DHS20C09_20990 [marine bacterium B5-7]
MKTFKFYLISLLLTVSSAAWSGLYWVGNSVECNGSNVYGTLNQALFVAALNGDPLDEIRLTNTVSYTGGNGSYVLQDWSSTGAGELTLVGGYPDCFGAASGRTLVGNSSSSSFKVNTNNETISVVTLKNLILTGNVNHGLEAQGGSVVFLDNVDITDNQFSGVNIFDGGFVDVLANTQIRLHNNINNPWGGGIRCTGAGSSAIIRNIIEKNRAQQGGNIYVSSGCYVEIKDGARIVGGANSGGGGTFEGGGIYVNNGGQVFADGQANRVIFDGNIAGEGGAIYINGTGFVLLQNTHINGSSAPEGSAIYAKDGGTASPQLIMDQTTDCNLLFRCSEIQGAKYEGSVVFVDNSYIQIQRTVIELSTFYPFSTPFANGLVTSNSDSVVRMNRVGFLRNEGHAMLRLTSNDQHQISHLTMAENYGINSPTDSFLAVVLAGSLNIQNSLITDSSGIDDRSAGASFSGGCNLIDNNSDWPAGLYHLGTPQLINPAAGDARQLAASPGVDMCLQDSFVWSTEIDIENQAAPVNENTNPQGMPGQSGGLYDAGFDEVYDNIGDDEFLLTIQKEGPGEGVVISNPSGISCGIDCSEVYFNGTIVTLFASPVTGNEFVGWLNCPLVNDDDECLTSVQSSHTIRAVFIPDDLIFYDGFE